VSCSHLSFACATCGGGVGNTHHHAKCTSRDVLDMRVERRKNKVGHVILVDPHCVRCPSVLGLHGRVNGRCCVRESKAMHMQRTETCKQRIRECPHPIAWHAGEDAVASQPAQLAAKRTRPRPHRRTRAHSGASEILPTNAPTRRHRHTHTARTSWHGPVTPCLSKHRSIPLEFTAAVEAITAQGCDGQGCIVPS
jgi:hypothetical protein